MTNGIRRIYIRWVSKLTICPSGAISCNLRPRTKVQLPVCDMHGIAILTTPDHNVYHKQTISNNFHVYTAFVLAVNCFECVTRGQNVALEIRTRNAHFETPRVSQQKRHKHVPYTSTTYATRWYCIRNVWFGCFTRPRCVHAALDEAGGKTPWAWKHK